MSEEVSEKERVSHGTHESDELAAVLGVISGTVPALVKGLIASVFSEEAGRNMGRGAAAYYSELKAGGIPDAEALKMTKDYVGMFAGLGELMKTAVQKGPRPPEEVKEEVPEKEKTEA